MIGKGKVVWISRPSTLGCCLTVGVFMGLATGGLGVSGTWTWARRESRQKTVGVHLQVFLLSLWLVSTSRGSLAGKLDG